MKGAGGVGSGDGGDLNELSGNMSGNCNMQIFSGFGQIPVFDWPKER